MAVDSLRGRELKPVVEGEDLSEMLISSELPLECDAPDVVERLLPGLDLKFKDWCRRKVVGPLLPRSSAASSA